MRAYKFRFYPTEQQKKQLAIEFGCARFAWNFGLEMRQKAYKRRGETIRSVGIDKLLARLKRLPRYSWLAEASSSSITQSLRHQDEAFKNFFAGHAGFPRFKSKRGRQSATYQVKGYRFVAGAMMCLPKLGAVSTRWSRVPDGNPKMVTVTLDPAGRYFVSFAVEEEITALKPVCKAVGVDLGIKDNIVTSDGWKSGAPRYFKRKARRLAMAQRRLSRKQKGSKRRQKARKVVAKIHARIADSRRDYIHKLTTGLIRENQAIALEDLNVSGMVRNRSLSFAIGDAGMREIRRQLEYKAAWYGREIRIIDRFAPSSKTCSECGIVLHKLPLDVRQWTCECGAEHDRDVNAARNILAFSTAGSAGINARRGRHNPETAAA